MILPTNGKVIIFDDKYKDVKSLLTALSKNGIPYNYFQDEGGEDLPTSPIQNVRVVFLDLQLISGQRVPTHSIISAIASRLERVLEPENNYVLVYWSTKEGKYKAAIDDAFENGLKEYKPILSVSLNKKEALAKKPDEIVDFITKQIEEKTDNFSLFKVFSLWENLVNDSAGSLINDFIEFIGKDDDWDDNAKYVLFKLAQAYSGVQVSKKAEIEQLEDAFFTLNYTLLDSIENRIFTSIENEKGKLKNIIEQSKKSPVNFSSMINRRLFLYKSNFTGNIPGCMFLLDSEYDAKIKNEEAKVEALKKNDKIDPKKKPSIVAKSEEKFKKLINVIDFQRSASSKNYNVIVNDIIKADTIEERIEIRGNILADSLKIEVNISPLCDYAQDKMNCCRLLPGILLPSKYYENINTKNTYNYVSDSILEFDGVEYYYVFDMRFLYSKPETTVKKRIAEFKIRHQLLGDIQLRLGNHINRSGVLLAP